MSLVHRADDVRGQFTFQEVFRAPWHAPHYRGDASNSWYHLLATGSNSTLDFGVRLDAITIGYGQPGKRHGTTNRGLGGLVFARFPVRGPESSCLLSRI